MAKNTRKTREDDGELLEDDAPAAPEVYLTPFTQTAHVLAPANSKNLMSVPPYSSLTKRPIAPISAAMVTREYSYPVTFSGGAYGDETLATANATDPYSPKTLPEYAALPGGATSVVPSESVTGGQALTTIPDYVPSTVVNSPRGWIDPAEPYGPAPVSPADDPTISSLTPNTAATGGNPIWVTINGSKFTTGSSVETGNVYTPYSKYFSPTKMAVLLDPRSSPGVISIVVVDHGVKSAAASFTFT